MEIRKKRVDEDWKLQAEKEKEKIVAEERRDSDAADGGEGAPPGAASLVPIFEQLASQAMAGLGQLPDPRTGGRNLDLEMARMAIDLLSSMEQKTKGRLTADEKQLIEELLQALRSGFVQVQQALAQQQAGSPPGGDAGPGAPPGM